MKKGFQLLKKLKIASVLKALIACCFALAFTAFAATQAIYWLNLDNKFMFLLYKVLRKHTNSLQRDRRF